jgi:hypothetical protein
VAAVVEEPGAPPPPVTAAAVEEGWTTMETAAPKRHWSHQPGLARAARTWRWCPRTKTRRRPHWRGIVMSLCQRRRSLLRPRAMRPSRM